MIRKTITILTLATAVAALALPAAAPAQTKGIPDLSNSYAVTAAPGPVSICNVPDGSGQRLRACYLYGGQEVDARITLTVLDMFDDPVFLYPHEDLWLESADGALAICPGGTVADEPTNIDGETTFSHQLFAGGQGIGTVVMINGDALDQEPFAIDHNSPDLTGDLVVDLSDIATWASDWATGVYRYRSDLHWDGVLDISDVALLVRAVSATCP